MGFWSSYKSSLKPAEVDEPIDVWVHRPLGYVIARLAAPTALTPNHITAISFVFGALAGSLFFASFPGHLPAGGLCLFTSQVFDCADGQLARMQKSGTLFGRMFDGTADALGSVFVGVGATWATWVMFHEPLWHGVLAVAACVLTIYSSQFQTSAYDHFKNVFVRMTEPGRSEGEDLEEIQRRGEEARARGEGLFVRFSIAFYVDYLTRQRGIVRRLDPFTPLRLADLPAYSPEGAAIYRRRALAPMRLWKSFFGVGSLMFGIAFFYGIGHPEILIAARLVLLNGLFWLHLVPAQRRASAEAFREIARLPAPESEAEPVEAGGGLGEASRSTPGASLR